MSEGASPESQGHQARIQELERRLADARARLPKHSPPVSLFIEIDELEAELTRLRTVDDNDAHTN
jgi:hypothetical protein